MQTKYKFTIPIVLSALSLFFSCKEDVLDRMPLTTIVDEDFWRTEEDIRLYANGFYENYFIGYNTDQSEAYGPYPGSNFSDDMVGNSPQTNFESIVPASRASTSTAAGGSWLVQHHGPTWNFYWVRKSNIFIDRIENVAKPNLSEEEYSHWMAVARFFNGLEYSMLVSVFGDVPYFDRVVEDTDFEYMYKDRDDRGFIMDQVYADFEYVLDNMRIDDGTQELNRYIAAAFISRRMLFEGTFLHYHNGDVARAQKYLELAVRAAEIVMNSGQYSFSSDYRSLFASESLAGNREVLLHRTYDEGLQVRHSAIARQNGAAVTSKGANLDLIKAFLCVDGQPWQNSVEPQASSFSIADLITTRDSRFEASFLHIADNTSPSQLLTIKHAPRDVVNYIGPGTPSARPEWLFGVNTTDAPVIRLAEVVLNWVEAKAVLAENYGGAAIVQGDLDRSINAIRDRPLAPEAVAKGVRKTARLLLTDLPADPERDIDVSPLMWEIRRERRIEFYIERFRLLDLKRWKKMEYMDFSSKPDYFLGPWMDVPAEMPALIAPGSAGVLQVQKENGTVVTYNGSNASDMVGFYVIRGATNRQPFGDEVYMAPIGEQQIVQYEELGYTLTQTVNW